MKATISFEFKPPRPDMTAPKAEQMLLSWVCSLAGAITEVEDMHTGVISEFEINDDTDAITVSVEHSEPDVLLVGDPAQLRKALEAVESKTVKHKCNICRKDCGGCMLPAHQCVWLLTHTHTDEEID